MVRPTIASRLKYTAVRFGLPVGILLGAGAMAYAQSVSLVTFTAGSPLHAADLNTNFSELQSQITALQTAPAPTTVPAAAITVETANCVYDSTSTLTDCTCATNQVAISGGAYAGTGADGTNWIAESRNGATSGLGSNLWRITCVSSSTTKRVECVDAFAICVAVQ